MAFTSSIIWSLSSTMVKEQCLALFHEVPQQKEVTYYFMLKFGGRAGHPASPLKEYEM